MSDDEDEEAEQTTRKKQRTGAGGGKRCVCGPNGCMRAVTESGFRLRKKMSVRLEWLHCFYPPEAVPEEYTQDKPGDRRVHPCHFKPEDLELRDREGGSGARSGRANIGSARSHGVSLASLWQSSST